MSTIIKVQRKGQVTIPTHLRSKAGINQGDLVEAAFERGKIILTPKLIIDRAKFPSADDEYTPGQRQIIDRDIAQSLEEFKKGRSYGPFHSADEMIEFLHGQVKRSRQKKMKSSKSKAR